GPGLVPGRGGRGGAGRPPGPERDQPRSDGRAAQCHAGRACGPLRSRVSGRALGRRRPRDRPRPAPFAGGAVRQRHGRHLLPPAPPHQGLGRLERRHPRCRRRPPPRLPRPMMGLIAGGIIRQVDASGRWMAWNVALALAPWFLSLVLFRPYRRPGAGWLCGALTCLLLVPNAPYIFTDVVHLPADVRREPSDAIVLFVVFPMYATLLAIGFATYSDALRRLTRYA